MRLIGGRGPSVGRRIAVLVAGSVVGGIVVVCATLFFLLEGFLDHTERADDAVQYAAFQRSVQARKDANLLLAIEIARDPEIAEFMRQGRRAELMERLAPGFSELRATFAIDNVHLHSAAGVSLLRMHAPNQHGDTIGLTRHMVRLTNTPGGQATGLEWGVNGLAIRSMRAVTAPDGTHVGLVEVGSFVSDALLRRLVATPQQRVWIHAAPPGEALRLLARSHPGAMPGLEPAEDRVAGGVPAPSRRVMLDGIPGEVTAHPLRDFSGATIGIMQIWRDRGSAVWLRTRTLGAFLVLAFAGGIIALIAARRVAKAVTAPVLDLARQVERLRAGDLEARSEHAGRPDEIGVIARAVDQLGAEMALGRRKDALLQHRDRLEALGTMTGKVAHEMNNALQPALLATDALREDADPANVRYATGILHDSLERTRRLLRSLLDYARRHDAEDTLPPPVPVRIADALATGCTVLHASLGPGQTLAIESVPEGRMLCHEPALAQVLLNLCRNAFDAMGGRGHVELSAALVDLGPDEPVSAVVAPGAYVRIDVRDHGPGIPDSIRDKVMEPFFTTKPAGSGTGLGLSIAYGMIMAYGGQLSFSAAEGGGTVFHILLPLAEPAVPQPTSPTAHAT
ncbi:MAG: HAMP domain-containing protein [Acetobacteraceae bacterium]|nr:HAMP domain-containing protein [Acetobacteraceae bacterium]